MLAPDEHRLARAQLRRDRTNIGSAPGRHDHAVGRRCMQFSIGFARWPVMRLVALVLAAGCSAHGGDPPGTGACAHDSDMPTDSAVAACLSERRAELTTLVSMAERDSLTIGTDRIGDCWRLSGEWGCGGLDAALRRAGMSAARYQRYVELLTIVGGYRIEHHGDATTIALFRAGIVPSGSSKNLVYAPRDAPSPIVADTDRDRPTHFSESYAALGGGWYVEHSSN
jgi:hypothetical protein